MVIIRNLNKLTNNGQSPVERKARELALKSLESAINAVNPKKILRSKVLLKGSMFKVGEYFFDLTKYKKNSGGDLVGEIELPMAIGLIGGATTTHPTAKINVKILGVETAKELEEVIASVGLAQNLAALRALSSEGIQKGHMKLHAKNIAGMAGADDSIIEEVAGIMVSEGKVRLDRAKEIVAELKK